MPEIRSLQQNDLEQEYAKGFVDGQNQRERRLSRLDTRGPARCWQLNDDASNNWCDDAGMDGRAEMTAEQSRPNELKNIGYELFIGALSLLSIINLVLMLFSADPNLYTVLVVINAIMFPIFLGDFLYRFFTAENKRTYFFRGFGWADLLSSLPLQQLKILRVFRLWRVIRLFRAFGAKNLVREFIDHRAENALLTVGFLVLCVLEFGSLFILRAESASSDANITSASDAIWWAYVTITTVGYGDRYPVTNQGRTIAIVVMTAGVGLFGTLSGYLANLFLSPSKAEVEEQKEGEEEVEPNEAQSDEPKAKIDALRRMIEAQEAAMAQMKAELDEIETML
jgi:voltage-gated potassium channel